MRQKIVAGNWKMYGSIHQVEDLTQKIVKSTENSTNTEVVLLPPYIYLPLVSGIIKGSNIKMGAQNVYPHDFGAFTGEISGSMLDEFGCRYVLVGHSERRKILNEDEKFIARKFHHVKDHDMIPVLCVGETLIERENGLTKEVIAEQLQAIGNNKDSFKNTVIAYEPVWAIGTGVTATPDEAQEVHAFIRSEIAKINPEDASAISLLYGGSVNEKNARDLFSMPDVDGGLVGGASLNAEQFVEIIKCIN